MDVLKDYDAHKVVEAIRTWLKTSPEFPTPADILVIVDPLVKLDKSVYVNLCKRRDSGDYLLKKEKDYIRFYEGKVVGETRPNLEPRKQI